MDMKCPLSFRRSGLLQWQGSKQLTSDGGVGDNATLIWVFPKIGVPQNGWFIIWVVPPPSNSGNEGL